MREESLINIGNEFRELARKSRFLCAPDFNIIVIILSFVYLNIMKYLPSLFFSIKVKKGNICRIDCPQIFIFYAHACADFISIEKCSHVSFSYS